MNPEDIYVCARGLIIAAGALEQDPVAAIDPVLDRLEMVRDRINEILIQEGR
jgi:ribosome-associated translation inhibitor RaiA